MKHAVLSASGADKWFNCPGSINAEKGIEEEDTEFSNEGTLAHLLAEVSLNSGIPAIEYAFAELDDQEITPEMANYVQEYIDYVLSHLAPKEELSVELKVYFDEYASGGFGTLDASSFSSGSGTCHIFDLKYGAGIPVYAENNKQLMLYALGVLQTESYAWSIDRFVMHIHQPRIPNNSSFEMSVEDLKAFGEVVRVKAEQTLDPNAKRIPGLKQCQWCKAKSRCPELMEKSVIKEIGMDVEEISDERIREILDNRKLSKLFISSLEKSMQQRLETGGQLKGYKLVQGTTRRAWSTDGLEKLKTLLGDDAYTHKIIGLGDAEKKLSKEEVGEMTYKPEGKLTLAPESDKRTDAMASGFDDLTMDK